MKGMNKQDDSGHNYVKMQAFGACLKVETMVNTTAFIWWRYLANPPYRKCVFSKTIALDSNLSITTTRISMKSGL